MPDAGSRWASVSERVYEALLAAYPKEFREEYGPRMMQAFGDLCREELRRGGAFGLARLWVRTIPDLVKTAFVERRKTMRQKLLIPLALIVGLLIALVDSSPGWDDTGVTAFAILVSSGLFGAIHPARPWLYALAVGSWIPFLGITLQGSYESLPALAFAFAGAYAGKLVSRFIPSET